MFRQSYHYKWCFSNAVSCNISLLNWTVYIVITSNNIYFVPFNDISGSRVSSTRWDVMAAQVDESIVDYTSVFILVV